MEKVHIQNSRDYWVTREGRVFRGEKELKKSTMHSGYKTVTITYEDGKRKNIYVHRLIALTFIPNLENKPFVNHKNLVKTDNRVENLEWVTHQENMRHAHDAGAFRNNDSKQHHHAIFSDELIHKVCSLIQDGRRNIDIVNLMNIPKHLVQDIRQKRIWNHISDEYVFVKPRIRRLSDQTATWICKMIVEGKTPKEISEMSGGKVSRHAVKDIKQKKAYRDISDKYF